MKFAISPSVIYPALVVAGMTAGFLAARPIELRRIRPFQMVLLPILACALYGALQKMADSSQSTLSTVLLVSSISGIVFMLCPNLTWLYRRRVTPEFPRFTGYFLDDDVDLQQTRNLVQDDKFLEACRTLEKLLQTHRATFAALLLLAQLYHQLQRNKEARHCLLLMLRATTDQEEQLTALRLYHQLDAA